MTPDEIIATLAMLPHPEGGHYVETWRHERPDGQARERSHWHRVDATEIWHWYAGAPLALSLSADGVAVQMMMLGNDLASGARPQFNVPAGMWQSAASTGPWTLVGCTVSPAFEFAGLEMAPP